MLFVGLYVRSNDPAESNKQVTHGTTDVTRVVGLLRRQWGLDETVSAATATEAALP